MTRFRRRGIDPMIAMINMVFILLAFFIMGEIKTPQPNGIELPLSVTAEDVNSALPLFISRDAQITNSQGLASTIGESTYRIFADKNIETNELIRAINLVRQSGGTVVGLEVRE